MTTIINLDPKGFIVSSNNREFPKLADLAEITPLKPAITSKPGWDGRKS